MSAPRSFSIARMDREKMLHATERTKQEMLEGDGVEKVGVVCISTPPGGGSPEGMHTHAFDQMFVILEGVMSIEIDGKQDEAGPGTTILFPAGKPHRNWNAGDVNTVHLNVMLPVM